MKAPRRLCRRRDLCGLFVQPLASAVHIRRGLHARPDPGDRDHPRMPTDVFPNINIPVVSVVYNYAGMSPDDMEARIITQFERFVVTTVNDIDHIESQSLNGVGVIKIFFQKNA